MKLKVILLVCATLMLSVMAAQGAELDFSHWTLEELYAARDAIDARIGALEQADSLQIYDSGSYLIGKDIPAGDYVLVENDDAVFASVIVREGVTEDSGLVSHHLINRQAVVRLTEGKWMTLTEAQAYPIAQATMIDTGTMDEGGYLVGAMLPAGRYSVNLIERAPLSSYSVYDGVLGTGEQLLKFEVIRDTTELTLNDGEYIELSGCRLEPAELD